MEFDLHMALVILAAAVATFATRIGGYILITRMKSIPPRVEAALNAVPAAVRNVMVNSWREKLRLPCPNSTPRPPA